MVDSKTRTADQLMASAITQKLSAFLLYRKLRPIFTERREINMFISLSFILFFGFSAGWVCRKLCFPSLFGMILAGMAIGPYGLNWLDGSVLGISNELRKIALIIILLRAGITLSLSDLKKVGRPAVLMCFLPACFEMAGMVILAPVLLQVSMLDAAVMGAVVAAVSPAVIVPRMIRLIEGNYGTDKAIPQLILAGASVDDVFVIVMFGLFSGFARNGGGSLLTLMKVPISILTGIAVGFVSGCLLSNGLRHVHIRHTEELIIFLSFCFLFVALEDQYSGILPFSSLIAILFMGISAKRTGKAMAESFSDKLNKLWVAAEIFLFVLVGASVDIGSALSYGAEAILLIFGVLIFRITGVFLCLVKTNLNIRERIFCAISYIPKATVQAAIGGLPLAMGLGCGNAVVTVSVLSILITAPLGAFGIDYCYPYFIKHR